MSGPATLPDVARRGTRPTAGDDEQGCAWSWPAAGLAGVECFRAVAFRHRFGRHSHDAYSFGVFEAGAGGNRCRGALHTFRAPDVMLMMPDEAHTGSGVGGEAMTYRMLYVRPTSLADLLPEGAPLPFFRNPRLAGGPWSAEVLALHRRLEDDADPLAQRWHLQRTLAAIAAAHGGWTGAAPQPNAPRAIARVKEYLRGNYHRAVSVEELAQLTGLHRAYVIRAFHRHVGSPPHVWLLQVRLAAAKRLLAEGKPIAEAAIAAGFADQSHLTRHFRSATGLTPRQYAAGARARGR